MLALAFFFSRSVAAQQGGSAAAGPPSEEALAKQLANPIADLVSIPFRFNWDSGAGSDWRLRAQFAILLPTVVPQR